MTIASCLTDVPHPGEFLKEEMDARGWAQRDLAYILGVQEQAINLIVSGKLGISPEIAKALGDAFDVSPDYFANLQKSYEMSNARTPDPGDRAARGAARSLSSPRNDPTRMDRGYGYRNVGSTDDAIFSCQSDCRYPLLGACGQEVRLQRDYADAVGMAVSCETNLCRDDRDGIF